jgi:hypothetical protein
MENEDLILNAIAKSFKAAGKQLLVHREGKGTLGTFSRIERSRGSFDYSVNPPVERMPPPNFWTMSFTNKIDGGEYSKAEVISKSVFENLEVRKISDKIFHVIIPA